MEASIGEIEVKSEGVIGVGIVDASLPMVRRDAPDRRHAHVGLVEFLAEPEYGVGAVDVTGPILNMETEQTEATKVPNIAAGRSFRS